MFFKELHSGIVYDGPFVDDIDKEQKLFLQKGEVKLQLEKFSDGEKVLLLLISDISRQLVLSQTIEEESIFGIVLIDELELHLHPGWQRKVISALMNYKRLIGMTI